MPMPSHNALISICTECLLILANGVESEEQTAHALNMSDSDITIGCGSDDCSDCGGGSTRFATSRCDCCGESLAGHRHCAVTWWSEPAPSEPMHAGYPHSPGYLLDCEACEAECHCEPGAAECVWSGHDTDDSDDTETRTVTIPRGTVHLSSDAVRTMLADCEGVREISDACAVTIAAWHQVPRGPGEAFTRLASHFPVTVADLLDAIAYERSQAVGMPAGDRLALDMLATWALNRHRAQVNA